MDDLNETTTATVTKPYDNVGGKMYPRIKMTFGEDGTATDVSATNPLPITADFPEFPSEMAISALPSIEGEVDTFLKDKLAGEDLTADLMKVEHRYSYQAISTATTTTLKTSAGLLHSITVTGGTAGTIVGYDNTAGSGTKIFDFDSTNAIETYKFDVSFATGLTIVTGGATKLTVSFR